MNTEIILGTAQLGSAYGINNNVGKLSLDQAFSILDAAQKSGIRILDTAEVYGDSQAVIGKYHQCHTDIRFSICTKLSGNVDVGQSGFEDMIENQIKDDISVLNCDDIDIYYLHSFDMCKNDSLMHFLDKKKGSMIRNVGVSIYTPNELEFILNCRSDIVDVVQLPFNLLNCSQWLNGGLLQEAFERGIALIARSVYVQGLIFMEPQSPFVESLGLSDVVFETQSLAAMNNMPIAELACQFVNSVGLIPYIIFGCEKPEQVEENARIMQENSLWTTDMINAQIAFSSGISQHSLDPRFWPNVK